MPQCHMVFKKKKRQVSASESWSHKGGEWTSSKQLSFLASQADLDDDH